MADLHADIARRMLAREAVQLGPADAGEGRIGLRRVKPEVDLAVRELGEGVHAGLGGLELAFEAEMAVRSERRGAESGDEDVARADVRIGDDAVRPLDQERPQAALEQGLPDLSGVHRSDFPDAEIDMGLTVAGFDEDGEELALVAPHDRLDRAADRGGQEDVGVLLVRHDGGAAEHGIAFLDQQSGQEALDVRGLDGYDARRDRLGDTEFRFTRDRDGQTPFQNDGL